MKKQRLKSNGEPWKKTGGSHPSKKDTVDIIEFGNCFQEFTHGLITGGEMAERLGVTMPTLNKYFRYWYEKMERMIADEKLEWKYPEKESENDG